MFKVIAAPALALAVLGTAYTSLGADPPKAAPAKAPAAAPSRSAPLPLELTPAQRQQAETLRSESERQLAPLREQLVAKRKELHALWTAEKPDRAAILKKESEMDGLRQKMRQVFLDQRLAYLALLTPEQRSAWRAHAPDGRGGPGMGGHGMGNMHGGMGGYGMGMRGGPPPDGLGADECMAYMDCEAPCMQSTPPAPPATSKPAGPPPATR